MTSRTKPTAKRSSRFGNDNRDRHSLYVNLAFGFVILLGVIFLVGAAAATYLGAHFAEAAKVNGQTITEDDVNQRGLVDGFRLNAAEAQLRDQNQLGRITDAELQQRLAVIEQQRQSLSSTTLDRLIDATLQGQLAAQKGIAVTDADVDQRLVDEATQKEQRHIGTITIAPEVTTGATDPTDAQKAAAKAAADKALADIKGGKSFEDVAKAVSTDAYAATGGDAGWLVADDQSLDPAVLTAAFALTAPGVTDVVAGDGRQLRHRPGEGDRAAGRRSHLDREDQGCRDPAGFLSQGGPGRSRPRPADEEGRAPTRPSSRPPSAR